MAFPTGTAYHADSDADDEYERSVMTSPTQLHTDSEASPSDSEPPSAEHTPTTYAHSGEDRSTPRTIITEWTAEESADFVVSLGLRQYCDAFLENEIVGEALIALKHDELKEMGIASVGHRLTILKGVYEIKISQDIPVDSDHYVPLSAEQSRQNEVATQEDVQRIIQSLRLRDERIIQAESELRRLADDYRRLREELLPVFRMAKDQSQPLPYGPPYGNSVTSPELYNHNLTSPPAAQNTNEKTGNSLTRSLSKKLFPGSTPKTNSPTHVPNTIHEGRALDGRSLADNTSLDPSAAATAASNHLTAQMSGGLASSLPNTSPSSIPAPSPTSPAPYLASRSYTRDGNTSAPTTSRSIYDNHNDEPIRSNTTPQPLQNGPTSASKLNAQNVGLNSSAASIVPSSKDRDRDRDRDRTANPSSANAAPQSSDPNANSVEIFKSFRVGLEDPCWKVLPAALRKYNIQADWRQYALYIVFGDQERCVGLDEKPLSLFKQYDKEGKKPMFMLRKLTAPLFDGQGDGGGNAQSGGGAGLGVGGLRDVSSASSLRGPVQPFNLPGGVV